MTIVLVVLASILVLLGLVWLAQHDPGWCGEISLYIVLFVKWIVIAAIALFVILGIGYVIYIS